jgi:hypothetical protein
MPSLLDMLQAVPRCGRRRMRRQGQHGVHFTCWEPMLYFAPSNLWHCPDCDAGRTGLVVAAQRAAAA